MVEEDKVEEEKEASTPGEIDYDEDYLRRFNLMCEALEGLPRVAAVTMINNITFMLNNESIVTWPKNTAEVIKHRLTLGKEMIGKDLGTDKSGYS